MKRADNGSSLQCQILCGEEYSNQESLLGRLAPIWAQVDYYSSERQISMEFGFWNEVRVLHWAITSSEK